VSHQDQALSTLAKALGDDPPAGLAALSRGSIADLVVAVEEAKERQSKQLEASVEKISRLLPRPTRFLLHRATRG